MKPSKIQKLADQQRAKINGMIARFEAAGCKYVRTRWEGNTVFVEGSSVPFPPEPDRYVDGLPHYATPAFGTTAAMRDCVDCCTPFYSRSAANVVCLPCKEASTATFEGEL